MRFYVIMDKDNDGLDPVELLEFIQGNQEEMAQRTIFSFVEHWQGDKKPQGGVKSKDLLD